MTPRRHPDSGRRRPGDRQQVDPARVRRIHAPYRDEAPVHGHRYVFPASGMTYDMHYLFETGIVLSGVMRRRVEQVTVDLRAGQPWYCGMWEPHGFQVLQAPCEAIILFVDPQFLLMERWPDVPDLNWLTPFVSTPAHRPTARSPGARKQLLVLGRKMREVIGSRQEDHGILLRLLTLEALLATQPEWQLDAGRTAAPEQHGRIGRIVAAAMDGSAYMTEQDAAAMGGMSRNAFARAFQSVMGVSFAKYALLHRISGAARDLLAGDEPLKSIALSRGFTDVSHFCRRFRRHYGCTPSEYRRRAGPPA